MLEQLRDAVAQTSRRTELAPRGEQLLLRLDRFFSAYPGG
jgi:hypothetical protein